MDTLGTYAAEESTYVVTVSYTDEDGAAVTPNTVTWTLKDEDGNVVNSRLNVSIATPGTSNDIVLYGDDLAILKGKSLEKRILSIDADYDSAAGSGLPLHGEVAFFVQNLSNF